MRYDKEICFCLDGSRTYDQNTGDYVDSDPVLVKKPASVMDTTVQTMNLVYGEIREGSLIIHLQNHYDDPFDRIIYNGRRYRVDAKRNLRTKQVFIVSEEQ